MSFQHLNLAWNAECDHPHVKSVLVYLADRADKKSGLAFPSVRSIAHATAVSLRQVVYVLGFLESKGAIKCIHNRGCKRRNNYTVCLPMTENTLTGFKQFKRGWKGSENSARRAPLCSARGDKQMCTARQRNVHSVHSHCSIRNSQEPARVDGRTAKAAPAPPTGQAPTCRSAETLRDDYMWQQQLLAAAHAKNNRAKVEATERKMMSILDDLDRLGEADKQQLSKEAEQLSNQWNDAPPCSPERRETMEKLKTIPSPLWKIRHS